jgi:hypothetical protein
MARASIALSVGAAKLTKIRGKFGLAKIGSSVLGISRAQTIEYKGFGGKNASKMAGRAFESQVKNLILPERIIASRYD